MFFGKTFAEKDREWKGDKYDNDIRELNRRIALLKQLAQDVVAFDWSDNDADAVAAIEALRKAVNT